MAGNLIPSFGDLDKLSNGDRASDTLEQYQGWARWTGDDHGNGEPAMLFSISNGQGAKQGFVYGITLGLAALHDRVHELYLYKTDADLRKTLEIAFKLHGEMTIAILCSTAKEKGFTVDKVETKNVASSVRYWIWLKKVR